MAYRGAFSSKHFAPDPPPKALHPPFGPTREVDPAVPRLPSGRVDVGKVLLMKPQPKWMAEARAARDEIHRNKEKFPHGKVLAVFPTPGLRVAPLEAYGNHEAVAQHLYQWDPSTTKALHFKPDRWTMMIDGRPMQASSLLS